MLRLEVQIANSSTGRSARRGALALSIFALAACSETIPPSNKGTVYQPACQIISSQTPEMECPPVPPAVTVPIVPSDLPGLSVWFRAGESVYHDAAATTPATHDGDTVGNWRDSAQQDGAVAADAAHAPVLRSNQINGLPAVCFSGDQYLTLAQPITLHDHTILVVTRPDFTQHDTNVILGGPSNYAMGIYRVAKTTIARLAIAVAGVGRVSDVGTPTSTWQVLESDRSGATWYPRVNGAALSLGSSTSTDAQVIASFGDYGQTYFYNGCIAEVIVYDRYLGDDERDQLRRYLAARYAIAGEAPVRVMYSGGPLGCYNMTPAAVSLLDGDRAAKRPATILSAFRNGPQHTYTGEVMVTASHDGGFSWDAPIVAAQDPAHDVRTNNGMVRLSDGTLLLPVEKETEEQSSMTLPITVLGTFLTRSRDNGKTWSPPAPVNAPAGYDWFYAYGTILERSDGSLLMPGYAIRSATGFWDSLLLRSVDRGASWTFQGVVAAGSADKEFGEAALAYQGATLDAVIGEDNAVRLWFASSHDDGRTWSDPQQFYIGNSPALLPLSNGQLLLAYAARAAMPGFYAQYVKFDGDGAFDLAAMLAAPAYPISVSDHWGVDLGYPAPVEMFDGRIFVNFYKELNGASLCQSQIWSGVFDLASLDP